MNRTICTLILCATLVACSRDNPVDANPGQQSVSAGEYERGPHRGRMLREGDFALEITIFETGVPPQFRLFAYQDGQPVNPGEVVPVITLRRLDGEVNRFTFVAENDYLSGSGVVTEPHSFDVEVTVEHAGRSYRWEYASYEGRTSIPAATAAAAGIEVEKAGPAVIRDTAVLMGTILLDANRHANVRARFPGIVRSVPVELGQRVRRGQTLAEVEGNESMRSYAVTAPFDGTVLVRNTNVGDVAGDGVLFEIADLSQVWAELRAIGTDSERLARGQAAQIRSAIGGAEAQGRIAALLPVAGAGESVIARVPVPNPDGRWRPGMTVSATVTVASRRVPLAVRETALQRFRDFTVVFAQVADTYEVRMLELGDGDGEHVEVLEGLKPGTPYVVAQSHLIKADIEKAGASHDH